MRIKHRLKAFVVAIGFLALSRLVTACNDSPSAFGERITGQGADIYDADSDGQVGDQSPVVGERPTLISTEWTFQATDVEQALLEFAVDQQIVDEYFAMTDLTRSATMRHQQLERSLRTEIFGQGSEQQATSESFRQAETATGVLDLVIVIDNSSSMVEEQVNLASKMLPLLSFVAESDWRIGVVTTDPKDGCLRTIINKNDENYQKAFVQAIRAGTSGSGNERGIYQARNALQMSCAGGQEWLRPNSTLAVLIVSDEDNCSNSFMCFGAAWESSFYLTNYLDDIRQLGINARIYGLIWHPSQDQTQCPTALNQAHVYAEAIDRSQGQWGSICDADYSATLSSISEDLSKILKSQFVLQYTPYYTTVQVVINGIRQTEGYRVIGNVVEFKNPPPSGATIRIDYQFTTDPPKKSFQLFGQPVEETLEIYLDGSLSQNYLYDTKLRRVNFEKAPMVQEIKIVYRQGVELETRFALENGLDPKAIRVVVQGKAMDANQYSYDANSGLVSFHQAPKDGAEIDIHYQQIIGPRLRYPAFVPVKVGDAFAVYDALTMIPMNYLLEGRDLIFAETDHLRGRRLMIRYDNPFANSHLIDFGWQALPGSFKVRGTESGECDRIQVIGSQVNMEHCGFSTSENIWVEFDYIGAHHQHFKLEDRGIKLDESHFYLVLVNDKETTEYHLDGQILSFAEPLPLHASVTVKLMSIRDQ